MELNLKGKKALITGGSKGIGLAIRKSLEKEGVKVISWSRSDGIDFNKELSHQHLNTLKEIDILINNFGGGGTWEWEYVKKVMDRNYGVTQLLTGKFIRSKETNNYGRVITISSIFGKEKGHNPEFTAAKAAQIAYMKSLAGRCGEITFNTICPGHIDVGKPFPDKPEVIGKPEDVAHLVTFLCSNLANHINGVTICVDGGVSHSF
ncbi:MAG: SDR family oxidoreductase [Nanoarchaeota archaeon]|nr:SDR family oxidoreductase [Nanoarchaeota archaeon]